MAAAAADRRLYVFNGSGETLWQPRVLDFEGWSVAIADDGSRIAVGTAQKNPSAGTLYVFDRYGHEIFQERFDAPVWGIALSSNGETLAVSTWGNTAYRFIWTKDGFSRKGRIFRSSLAKGFYGINLSSDGSSCCVASYDEGVTILNSSFRKVASYELNTGLYNIDWSRDGDALFVGQVDGQVYVINPEMAKPLSSFKICHRPICGIATCRDGETVLAGSFDGKTYFCSRTGTVYWTYQNLGEVWSTALSADASIAAIGSGDKSVTIVHNHCTAAIVKDISGFEFKVNKRPPSLADLNDLIDLYKASNLVSHGVAFLLQLAQRYYQLSHDIEQQVVLWLAAYVERFPNNGEAHFLLAERYGSQQQKERAIYHFQQAAREPELRLTALTKASELFSQLGLRLSANASHARAREVHLDLKSRMILYNLARSYEGQGSREDALAIYQALLAWDISYRGALERTETLGRSWTAVQAQGEDRQDFTGITVSLLGPDIPRRDEVDHRLLSVIEARGRELEVIRGRRGELQDTWHLLLREGLLEPRQPVDELRHSIVTYLKYDYSPPEDELKKRLELLHAVTLVRRYHNAGSSLDIGTATGRYPGIFAQLGFHAWGIDVAADAIAFARQKGLDEAVTLLVADGRQLPFPSASFDVITCMMGTLAYMDREAVVLVVSEAFRCLKTNGLCILSTWDPKCTHLAFLIMYDSKEKQKLLANLLTQSAIQDIMHNVGFKDCGIQPIALVPDVLHYDLGLERVTVEDVRRLVEIELAALAAGPTTHGQMFLAHGIKPVALIDV